MRNNEPFKPGPPARQSFYEAQLHDGTTCIAEWRQHEKKSGKQWWIYRSDDPTVAKERQLLSGVCSYRSATARSVELALARQLTVAERVQASYEAYGKQRGGYVARLVEMPERRRLPVGASVEYGMLKDCRVAAVHEQGHVVTLEYHNLRREYGVDVDLGKAFLTAHWLDVVAVAGIKETALWAPTLLERTSFQNNPLDQVLHRVVRQGMNESPDYQRGYVWVDADKDRYLESVFTGRDLGRFIFVTYEHPELSELFDGKQRLGTLVELVSSRRSYRGVYWHEMSKMDRRRIQGRILQVADVPMSTTNRVDLLQMFLDVNAAGVPQTDAHLAHVRQLLAVEQRAVAQLH